MTCLNTLLRKYTAFDISILGGTTQRCVGETRAEYTEMDDEALQQCQGKDERFGSRVMLINYKNRLSELP